MPNHKDNPNKSKCVSTYNAAQILSVTITEFEEVAKAVGLEHQWRQKNRFGSMTRVWNAHAVEQLQETEAVNTVLAKSDAACRDYRREFARTYGESFNIALHEAADHIEHLTATATKGADALEIKGLKNQLVPALVHSGFATAVVHDFDGGTGLVVHIHGGDNDYIWNVRQANLPQVAAGASVKNGFPPMDTTWSGPRYRRGEKKRALMLIRWVIETHEAANGSVIGGAP